VASPGTESFGSLLRRLRGRAGLSQSRLARASGIDAAYVNRMEAAPEARALIPRPAVLERLCRALDLSTLERDRVYFAAGRCPPSLAAVGSWDPALAALAELLADESQDEVDRAELRQVLAILVARWRRSAAPRVEPAPAD
jgi:transcriptional regulator with XRE-family HTH domain